MISSAIIPAGYGVTVYSEANYTGYSIVLEGEISNLNGYNGYDWSDDISSIIFE